MQFSLYYSHQSPLCAALGRQYTMCEIHNFGLIFAGRMHCLPQRLKSTLFEIFSNRGCLKGTRIVEKISNNVDFSLWGNRATTWEYFLTFSCATKIMKIRHSVMDGTVKNFEPLSSIIRKFEIVSLVFFESDSTKHKGFSKHRADWIVEL